MGSSLVLLLFFLCYPWCDETMLQVSELTIRVVKWMNLAVGK